MLAVLDSVRYAAANALARGRMAQLLPVEIWQALLAASDLEDLVSVLSQTAYGVIPNITLEQTLEPETLEQELWAFVARSYRSLLKLVPGQPGVLLDWLGRRFELDNLKTLLRTIAGEVPAGQIKTALIPLSDVSELPWTGLAEANSVTEVTNRLRTSFNGAFYARAMEPALDRYRREKDVFGLEVTLDLAYYRRLLRLLDNLSGRDREEAGRLIGTMVNIQNLLWAFRYRVYFDLSPEEILNYTLHRRLRVNASVVRQIAAGASIEAVAGRVGADPLPDLSPVAELSPEEALPELELIFQRHIHNLAGSARQGYPFHLGALLAYELLLESEVRDLMTIIEGKVAGWTAPEIRPGLIGQRG